MRCNICKKEIEVYLINDTLKMEHKAFVPNLKPEFASLSHHYNLKRKLEEECFLGLLKRHNIEPMDLEFKYTFTFGVDTKYSFTQRPIGLVIESLLLLMEDRSKNEERKDAGSNRSQSRVKRSTSSSVKTPKKGRATPSVRDARNIRTAKKKSA